MFLNTTKELLGKASHSKGSLFRPDDLTVIVAGGKVFFISTNQEGANGGEEEFFIHDFDGKASHFFQARLTIKKIVGFIKVGDWKRQTFSTMKSEGVADELFVMIKTVFVFLAVPFVNELINSVRIDIKIIYMLTDNPKALGIEDAVDVIGS